MGELKPAIVAWKDELQQDLDSIQKSGDFAFQMTYSSFVNPGLEIDGTPIPLPLDPLVADRIKGVGKAPSLGGIGTDVVEYSPNLIWELHHGQFRIANPSWSAFFDTIKQDVAHGLGLAPSDVDFQPDKLLLYEKGSFVKRHKIPQENPGATAHLVICLPSGQTGGDIRIEHAGRHRALATAPASAFNLSSLAWYGGFSQQSMEITSGHRLELTYRMTGSFNADWVNFLIDQYTCLKERFDRWPKALSKLVYPLDHECSKATLPSTNLEGRNLAVVETLDSVCSESGIYVFLGNVTKKECDQGHVCPSDDFHSGFNLEPLCTTEGIQISPLVSLSEQHLISADPYSNRSADEVEEVLEGRRPNKLVHNGYAVVLIPRNKLHKLLEQGTKADVIMALVADDQQDHPSDVSVRADMIRTMRKVIDSCDPELEFVENAWCLRDMPLYREAIRRCAADKDVLHQLPKWLATLVSKSSAPQVVNWSEGLNDLLDWCPDIRRKFVVLSEFEQALETKCLQDSFRSWAATLKRDEFTSSRFLAQADLDSVQELATSLWHDKDWVEQRFVHELGRCPNRTLIIEVINTLVQKGRDSILPGAEKTAKKILNEQLRRLRLGKVNLFSSNDQLAANKLHKFIDTVRMCLVCDFVEELLSLIKSIKTDMEQQRHCLGQRFGGVETGVNTPYEPILAHKLVQMLDDLLQDADEAPFMEPLRDLFEYLLRNYVLTTLSLHPVKIRRRALKDLRVGRVRRILGDSLFRELILLEIPPTGHGDYSQTVAGVKRKAEEELSPPRRSGDIWWIA